MFGGTPHEIETLVNQTATIASQLDAGVLTGDELTAAAVALNTAQRHLDALRSTVLAELDRTRHTDTTHGHHTHTWLATTTHTNPRLARTQVRVARRLATDLTDARQALTDGHITWDHCQVLCRAANPRIAHHITELLPELINTATTTPFKVWARAVATIAEQLDTDGAHRPDTNPDRNQLRLGNGFHGTLHLSGEFHGDTALELEHLLNTRTNDIWRREQHLNNTNGNTSGNDGNTSGTDGNRGVVRSRASLMADALLDLLRDGSAVDRHTTTPARPDITLIVNPDGHTTTPDGHTVPTDILHGLFNRGLFHTVTFRPDGTVNGPSTPVDTINPNSNIGRIIARALGDTIDHEPDTPNNPDRGPRFANRALRRAIAVRDGGCVFPGCDIPISWCDYHHVVEWQHGGHTTSDNLAALCRFHHGVTHRNGWAMTTQPGQRFTWTTPTGNTIHSQRHHQPPPKPPDPIPNSLNALDGCGSTRRASVAAGSP